MDYDHERINNFFLIALCIPQVYKRPKVKILKSTNFRLKKTDWLTDAGYTEP